MELSLTPQPRDWESLYKQTHADFAKQIDLNRKLRAEIRSLRRKLEDANRGAETNARALYQCSQRRHESSELAHKLGQELDKLKGNI